MGRLLLNIISIPCRTSGCRHVKGVFHSIKFSGVYCDVRKFLELTSVSNILRCKKIDDRVSFFTEKGFESRMFSLYLYLETDKKFKWSAKRKLCSSTVETPRLQSSIADNSVESSASTDGNRCVRNVENCNLCTGVKQNISLWLCS
jgi:hypothetical protein